MAEQKKTWQKRRVEHNKMKDAHKALRRKKAMNMMVHILVGNNSEWKVSENTITSPKKGTYIFNANEMSEIEAKAEELKKAQNEYAAKKAAEAVPVEENKSAEVVPAETQAAASV